MTQSYLQRKLLTHLPDILNAAMPASLIGIVCDENTREIAAAQIARQLEGRAMLVCLGKRVKPTIDTCEKLKRQVARCDAVLSVGSGTITDITKYVAHRLLIPFCAVATAPSMNGYLSPTASLIFGKQRSSVQAAPPRVLIADLDILCESPLKLVRAGIGDILCRSSIESDLILANRFIGTAYDPGFFTRLRQIDAQMREFEGEIHQRNEQFMQLMMEALLLGGQMMQSAGSSAPCSQSEHMVAHTYHMLYGDSESMVLHGEAIAVTTLSMVRMQQKLIHRKPTFRAVATSMDAFKRVFGQASYESLFTVYEKKRLSKEKCDELNDRMPQLWPEIKEEVEQCAVRALLLENAMAKFGCKTRHEQLRWNKSRYKNAVESAYLTRDRFTFLDIPAMDRTLRAEI